MTRPRHGDEVSDDGDRDFKAFLRSAPYEELDVERSRELARLVEWE